MTPPAASALVRPRARGAAPAATDLHSRFTAALAAGPQSLDALRGEAADGRRDRFLTLLSIYDLHTAPLEVVGQAARHQGHPAVAEVKARLEAAWLDELDQAWDLLRQRNAKRQYGESADDAAERSPDVVEKYLN